ncbi:MAG: hypothetical protein ABR576_09825 [Thermoanaerobaculia bacterium]
MRHRAVLLGMASVLLLGTGSTAAAERAGYHLDVVVDGLALPEYRLGERTYVEAVRGRDFSLRVRNPWRERVAVAIAVDGRNVIDAKRSTALRAAKWVLAPGEVLDIPGWQISGETARRFFFTETRSSYAKWLGDTRNVGTIEAVFFREKRWDPPRITENRSSPAPEARKDGRDRAPEGGVEGGTPSDAPASPSSATGEEIIVSGEAPLLEGGARKRARPRESDRYAATGAGDRTEFPVQWVAFTEDPTPVAHLRMRYEFHPELVRLGVLLPREDLHARERGRGFEREYAPDPRPER